VNRKLTPYEKNLLARAGKSTESVADFPDEMPIEYVIGFAEFCNVRIEVNSSVLIPRVETEQLVEQVAAYLQQQLDRKNLLEIGCGSGAISIGVAEKLKSHLTLYLTDIDVSALEIARKNVNQHLQENQQISAKIFQSDLLEKVDRSVLETLDAIVANLPYIPQKRMEQLDPSVRSFEPWLALDGGADGAAIITRFLTSAYKQKITCPIFLEVDDTHTSEFFKTNYPQIGKHFSLQFWNDFQNKNRFVKAQLKN